MTRKKPFSGKKKKEQLKAKRERRERRKERWYQSLEADERNEQLEKLEEEPKTGALEIDIDAILEANHEVNLNPQADTKRFALRFARETKEELERRKRISRQPLQPLSPEESLETGVDSFYRPGSSLDMPKRPRWNHDMSKEQVLRQEEQAFRQYLQKIKDEFGDRELSYFELNLETWRQLWRVLEISDVVFLVMDIRYAPLHFPPALFEFVVKEMGKHIVLILNKCDLVGEPTTTAWCEYFKQRFPEVHIATFASFKSINKGNPASRKKHRQKLRIASGMDQLLQIWDDLGLAGLDEWSTHVSTRQEEELARREGRAAPGGRHARKRKQRRRPKADRAGHPGGEEEAAGKEGVDEDEEEEEDEAEEEEEEHDDEEEEEEEEGEHDGDDDDDDEVEERPASDDEGPKATAILGDDRWEAQEQDGAKDAITIGVVGQPNVGKSTILNSIVGKTIVSTSWTPGHTKHLQTYFLTPHIRLCDCPGLIFPSLMAKPLQVLSGLYPVAQVREPFTPVKFLAERVDLVKLFKLQHDEDDPDPWSAWTICEAWAVARGFLTSRVGRPDAYRAANNILRHCVEGRIVLSLKPPGYFAKYGHAQHREHHEADGQGSTFVQRQVWEANVRPRHGPRGRHGDIIVQRVPQAPPAVGGGSDGGDGGGEGEQGKEEDEDVRRELKELGQVSAMSEDKQGRRGKKGRRRRRRKDQQQQQGQEDEEHGPEGKQQGVEQKQEEEERPKKQESKGKKQRGRGKKRNSPPGGNSNHSNSDSNDNSGADGDDDDDAGVTASNPFALLDA